MECFGDIRKLPALYSDSFCSLTRRFVAGRSGKEIVITETPNLVTKYDCRDAKSLKSWSFNELNKLLVPLVPGANDETLLGVHSGNTLYEWKLDCHTNEITGPVFTRSYQNSITAIVKLKRDSIVIFANGVADFFANLKSGVFQEEVASSVLETNEQLIGIECAMQKKITALYLIARNQDNNYLTIYRSYCKPSPNSVRTVTKLSKVIGFDCWTYHNASGNLIGALKKKDKIEIHSLEPTRSVNYSPSDPLFIFDSNLSSKISSIACCSDGAICVLVENSANESLFQLKLFETKFCKMIGQINLPDTALSKDFCIIDDTAYISCKNSVIVVPILKQKVLLSQLLTQNITESKNQVKSKNIAKFWQFLDIKNQDEKLSLPKAKAINENFTKFILIKCNEVPEELIVSVFDFCTRNYLLVKNQPDQEITDDKLIQNELIRFFEKLVRLPYNELFLISCFKSSKISFEQYLSALELLLNMSPVKECFIISWISSLLDVNFRQFIINPNVEAQAMLHRIHEHLNRTIHFYEDLGPIQTIFDSLIKRNKSVLSALSGETTTNGQYSIELLSFTY